MAGFVLTPVDFDPDFADGAAAGSPTQTVPAGQSSPPSSTSAQPAMGPAGVPLRQPRLRQPGGGKLRPVRLRDVNRGVVSMRDPGKTFRRLGGSRVWSGQ
jgi:hypothetical protein